MQHKPLVDEPHRPRRHVAGDCLAAVDRHHHRVAGVGRMEVRDAVFAVVHRDDDAVELADSRHEGMVVVGPDETPPPQPRGPADQQESGAVGLDSNRTAGALSEPREQARWERLVRRLAASPGRTPAEPVNRKLPLWQVGLAGDPSGARGGRRADAAGPHLRRRG